MEADAFAATWQDLMARHQILRTAFLWERRDEPCQVILRHAVAPLEWLDWSDVEETGWSDRLESYLREDRGRPFAMAKAQLRRLAIVRRGPGRHVLLLSHHHLILDAWSPGILLNRNGDAGGRGRGGQDGG